jgi:hypothetical protein
VISSLSLLAALVLLGPLGTAVVRWTLDQCGERPEQALKSGSIIGYLERSLFAVGVAFGSWEVIAAVVALKTVSRYKELDQQIPAEYFLVGSLSSLMWAVVVALTFTVVDEWLGSGWVGEVRSILEPDSA